MKNNMLANLIFEVALVTFVATSALAQDPQPKKKGGFFGQLGDAVKQGVNQGLSPITQQGGQRAVDANGLRNILPQFDPDKSVGVQWPHVAVTVLKSPTMWGDSAFDGKGQPVPGCFTLKAVVWDSAEKSKTVGPFDWCSPRDMEVKAGLGGSTEAEFNAAAYPIDKPFMTGIDRTEGPNPPTTLAPEDRATIDSLSRNTTRGATRDLSRDNGSKFGAMFWNLRYAMGESLTHHDFRVWIVKIEN